MTREELTKLYQDILMELPARTFNGSLEQLQEETGIALRHGRQKKTKDETLVSELMHLVPILKDCRDRGRFQAQAVISLPQVLNLCGRLASMRMAEYNRITDEKPELEELFEYFYKSRKEIFVLPPAKAFRTRYIDVSIINEVKEAVPKAPALEYPLARQIQRHFILHVGPTNTGKTYEALEDLKMAASGIYLAPLRLLAMEVQERLLDDGVFCSLLTGEEEDILQSATVMSATVEKLDITHSYEVAVIDECQMIADPQRGAAWTRAILGVRAGRVHVCMAPEAEHLVRSLISDCGDTYEIVRHRRKIPLTYVDRQYRFPQDIEDGDALVVFSRKMVLSLAAELRRMGINASVIYGALPYAARKRQVERFLSGESRVLVTTDAVGMGMNLPIRRIVFMDVVKYDGKERSLLTPAQTKQIAGRAGRQGMYDQGFVMCAEDTDLICSNLNTKTEEITQARLNFSEALLKSDYPLEELIRMWSMAQVPEKYNKMDTEEPLTLLKELRSAGVDIAGSDANELLYQMITIGFDIENRELVDEWLDACKRYLNGEKEIPFPDCDVTDLEKMETACKKLDLYYQMCHRFSLFCDEGRVTMEKDRLSSSIDTAITRELAGSRHRCRICGAPLPWNASFGICDRCYARQRTETAQRGRSHSRSSSPSRISSGGKNAQKSRR